MLENTGKFVEVKSYPSLKFLGYPACYVVPNDSSADFQSSRENVRTYSFIIRCFYETKEGGVEEAIQGLEDLIDTVIDSFDQEDLKTTTRVLGKSLPTGYRFIDVMASPSVWGELETENLLMAEVTVSVKIGIDIE